MFVPVEIRGQKIEICASCNARLQARVKHIQAQERQRRADEREIREAMRNARGDKRRGHEEVWQGSENDDTWLEEEPIP